MNTKNLIQTSLCCVLSTTQITVTMVPKKIYLDDDVIHHASTRAMHLPHPSSKEKPASAPALAPDSTKLLKSVEEGLVKDPHLVVALLQTVEKHKTCIDLTEKARIIHAKSYQPIARIVNELGKIIRDKKEINGEGNTIRLALQTLEPVVLKLPQKFEFIWATQYPSCSFAEDKTTIAQKNFKTIQDDIATAQVWVKTIASLAAVQNNKALVKDIALIQAQSQEQLQAKL